MQGQKFKKKQEEQEEINSDMKHTTSKGEVETIPNLRRSQDEI